MISVKDILAIRYSVDSLITHMVKSSGEGKAGYDLYSSAQELIEPYRLLTELERRLESSKIKVTEVKKEFTPLDPKEMRMALSQQTAEGVRSHQFRGGELNEFYKNSGVTKIYDAADGSHGYELKNDTWVEFYK